MNLMNCAYLKKFSPCVPVMSLNKTTHTGVKNFKVADEVDDGIENVPTLGRFSPWVDGRCD